VKSPDDADSYVCVSAQKPYQTSEDAKASSSIIGAFECRPRASREVWPQRQERQAGHAGLLLTHHDLRRQQGMSPVVAPHEATPPPLSSPLLDSRTHRPQILTLFLSPPLRLVCLSCIASTPTPLSIFCSRAKDAFPLLVHARRKQQQGEAAAAACIL
jgi:hypothetical protein